MVRLQETKVGIKSQYSITIPITLVKAKQWKKGQELLLIFNEKGNIEIREVGKK
jgi:bifunctional DNA-binding transcriptional regulator/antitoxin component of YhaV-PrlF toxin-antitoxin module